VKRYVSFAVVVMLVSPLLVLAQAPNKEPTPAEKAALAVKEITDTLKEARGVLKQVTDKATREKLELLIGRAELKAAELEKELAGLKPSVAKSMTDADFAVILKGLNAESFDSGKIKYVKAINPMARFTTAQAKQILAAFSFDTDRIEAGVILYPLVVDQVIFLPQVGVTFSFDSGRNALRDRINKK